MQTWLTAIDGTRERLEREAASPYAFAAVGLAIFAIWAFVHPYWGIKHDSILYTYAALARVHPESLAQDVFLRFGSQDQYTLFSPAYAGAIRLFGLDTAAALMTFVAQVAFFGCAWHLARRFMSRRLALLALGLLVVLPSYYGANQIFRYVEDFLTPREFAEACVLAAVAGAAARRHLATCIAIAAALLLHPIMGAAGIAILLTLYVAIPRPRLALALGIAGMAVLLVAAKLAPVGPLTRIDDLWWTLLNDRSQFLFVGRWTLDDWAHVFVPLGALAVGYCVCKDPFVRRLCLASIIIAVSGIALTLIGSDLMRILIVTQAQPWRWLWLSSVIAVLVIPLVARDAWEIGPLGRVSVVLVVSSWMFRADASALIVTALAVVAAVFSRHSIDPRRGRQLYLASLGVGIVAVVFNLANKWLLASVDPDLFGVSEGAPPLVKHLRMITSDGIAPACVLLLFWWSAFRWKAKAGPSIAAVAALVSCLAIVPVGWQSWSAMSYPPELYARYASWRALIPVGSEVFWVDEPLAASYLLERPSYISRPQAAGMVFSRASAMEILDRTQRMRPLYRDGQFESVRPTVTPTSHALPALRAACRQSTVDFVISGNDLDETPVATLALDSDHPNARMRLYRCADFRS